MVKWQATLSTTEPYNYGVGIINVRLQGIRTHRSITSKYCRKCFAVRLKSLQSFFRVNYINNKFPIQRAAKIIDAKKG